MPNVLKRGALALAAVILCVGLAGCSAEAKRARHLKRAEGFFKSGEYRKAEIEYINAGRLGATDVRIASRLGAITYEQGRIGAAYPLLTNAIARDPGDLDSRLKLARIQVDYRQLTNARALAQFVLAKRPADHEAMVLLGDTAANATEFADTRARIAELRKSIGETWSAHLALANLALREKHLDVASNEVEIASQLGAKSPQVNVAKAQFALMHKQTKEAEQRLRTAFENAPPRSPYRLALVRFKVETGQVGEAKALLDQILKSTPDFVSAWVLRGQIALLEKDLPECKRVANSVLTWDPANYDMRLLRGRVLLLQKEFPAAVKEFEQMANLYSVSADVRYQLAMAHLEAGETEKGLKDLDEAIRLNPALLDAHTLRAQVKLRAGAPDEVVALLVPFTKQFPMAYPAKLLLADAYRQLGKFDDAMAIYNQFTRQFPETPQYAVLAGSVLREQKRFKEARVEFEKALSVAPSYMPAVEQVVELDLLATNFVAAERRVNEHAARATNSAVPSVLQAKVAMAKADFNIAEAKVARTKGDSRTAEAQIALAKGDAKIAEAALQRAIQIEPNAVLPYSLLANLYLALGEQQKALTELRAVLQRNPKNAAALLQTAIIYDAMKDDSKAREAYEGVLKLNPSALVALNNLAYLLAERLNRVEEALPHAKKAREVAPNEPSTADTLGWILFRRGDYRNAVTLLRESAEKLANNAEVQFHLGMAEYMVGNEARARDWLTRTAQTDKTNPRARDIERKLAILNLDPRAADQNTIKMLETALKESPSDFIISLRLARAYDQMGAPQKARAEYEHAAKINASSPIPLLRLAVLSADKLNDLPGAMTAATAARKLAPQDPEVAAVLGRLAFRAGDFSVAANSLDEYARTPAADAEAQFDLALARFAVGQLDLARTAFQTYASATPAGPRAAEAKELILLADLCQGRGDAQKASAVATKRLQRSDRDIPALMTLGLVAQQNGKYSDAAQKLEQLVAIDKLFPLAQRQLAILYAEHLQNDQKAYEYGSKARQTFGDDPELAFALGKTSYRRGEFQNAVRLLNDAGTGQQQSNPATLYWLGMAYHKLGKASDAKTWLSRAVDSKLDPGLATEARKVLQQLK